MSNYKKALTVGVSFYLVLGASASQADFALNWARIGDQFGGGIPQTNCNRGEGGVACTIQSSLSEVADPDKTPFLQERIVGPDGQAYYHVVVGLPTSEFAQETFIRANTTVRWGAGFVDVLGSSSGGNLTFQGFGRRPALFANMKPLDPDEAISGNSTANPKLVEMRQVINVTNSQGQFEQEFLKDSLSNKPRITQELNRTVANAEIKAFFQTDLRALNYDDMNTAGTVTNTMSLPGGAGSFNMALDAQSSQVTAGQYRWVPGTGPGQSVGTWEYLGGGGFDPYLENWKAFRSATENPVVKIQ